MCVCVCVCRVAMFGDSGMCAEVTQVYNTISCLPIMSDRAATESSKYFKLGRQPYKFFNLKCLFLLVRCKGSSFQNISPLVML